MATFFHNITTILTQDLLTAGDKINSIKSITIANVHASASGFSLRAQVDAGDGTSAIPVDIIIKR